MKGIVLAGGRATRLYPLTAHISKHLLPVYDRQLIFYPLNTLISAGIRDILVIVSAQQPALFVDLLSGVFNDRDVNIFFRTQDKPRGLSDAFILGESFIENDDVMLVLGDNIFEHNFFNAVTHFNVGCKIFLKEVPDPRPFGVVEIKPNGKVVSIEEKPEKPKSNLIATGAYIFDSRVSMLAKTLKPSKRGELEITDLFRLYNEIDPYYLQTEIIEGEWLDAGTPESLLEAGNIVKEKGLYKNFHPFIEEGIKRFIKKVRAT
ncbi:MAG: sugar nucleotidyltransferase [Atribacterota bacterium]